MAIDCNDPNDQTQQSNLNRARGPYVNSNGEYNIDQIDQFVAALAQSALDDRETNPIIKLVNAMCCCTNCDAEHCNMTSRTDVIAR